MSSKEVKDNNAGMWLVRRADKECTEKLVCGYIRNGGLNYPTVLRFIIIEYAMSIDYLFEVPDESVKRSMLPSTVMRIYKLTYL